MWCLIAGSFFQATQDIFDQVDREEWYASLLSTTHLGGLLKFLCEQDRVENLLLISVKAGRFKQAEQVAQLYFRIRGESDVNTENRVSQSNGTEAAGATQPPGEIKYKALQVGALSLCLISASHEK